MTPGFTDNFGVPNPDYVEWRAPGLRSWGTGAITLANGDNVSGFFVDAEPESHHGLLNPDVTLDVGVASIKLLQVRITPAGFPINAGAVVLGRADVGGDASKAGGVAFNRSGGVAIATLSSGLGVDFADVPAVNLPDAGTGWFGPFWFVVSQDDTSKTEAFYDTDPALGGPPLVSQTNIPDGLGALPCGIWLHSEGDAKPAGIVATEWSYTPPADVVPPIPPPGNVVPGLVSGGPIRIFG